MPKLELNSLFRQASPCQVKLLFKQLAQTSIASQIAAIIIAVILWPVASHLWLLMWFSLISITTISRVVLARHFKKINPKDQHLEPCQDAALILITLAGIAWGSLAFIYDFNWPAFNQVAVISVLFILALGAIPAYATILPIYIISLTAVLLPLSVIFFLSGIENFPLYGAGVVAFGVVLLSIAKRFHDNVIQELAKNQNYVEDYQDLISSNDDL